VPRTYALPELPWEAIAGRLEQITISILRFDAGWKPPAWPRLAVPLRHD
jgi:hypothetical protein